MINKRFVSTEHLKTIFDFHLKLNVGLASLATAFLIAGLNSVGTGNQWAIALIGCSSLVTSLFISFLRLSCYPFILDHEYKFDGYHNEVLGYKKKIDEFKQHLAKAIDVNQEHEKLKAQAEEQLKMYISDRDAAVTSLDKFNKWINIRFVIGQAVFLLIGCLLIIVARFSSQ